MPDRTNATSTTHGVLRPDQLARHARIERPACAEALVPWVENYWCLRWELPPDTVFRSQTLPHPACTLSVELGAPRTGVGEDRVVVTGVVTRRFDVDLREAGWVLGVKFRPGGLAALLGLDASAWTDRTLPAASVLAAEALAPLRALTAAASPGEAAAAADAALTPLARSRPDDASYALVLDLVADMLGDRSLLRVADVEERHGVGRRRLERLFRRYVGASPKWVLARYRMHDAVGELDAGYDGALADLAATYGWYDQAHFTRDFVALVGVTPGEYRGGREPA